MAIENFIENLIPNLNLFWTTVIFLSLAWLIVLLIVVIVWIVTANKKKKGVDVSALAALAESDPMSDNAAANANPEEVKAILSIERVAASTALSAVKDARKRKRISSTVHDSLTSRYKARIAKIDADTKRRSGVQEYQHLADSLEQSKDRISGEVMPSPSTQVVPPPPPSSTPGIPSAAPPIPRPPTSGPPTSGVPIPPTAPTSGPPSMGTPPSKPSSPIPTPPRIPTVGPPTTKPSTIVPPSVAPPTISTPPLPPKAPTKAPTIAAPTTSNMAPPPVPQSAPTTPSSVPPPPTEGDGQSISGLRMEMLRELARLKKFMSDESQG